MKRWMIMLVCLLTLSIEMAGAYNPYAPNQFDAMERNSWEYQTTYDLTKAGLTGADMMKFSPGYSLTRYEMTQMVAEAIANRGRATVIQKKEIDKLAEAFSDDLTYLNNGNSSTIAKNEQPAGQSFDWKQETKTNEKNQNGSN